MSSYLRSVLARLLNRARVENDMDAEIRSHILHRAEDLVRSGMSPAEAERRARIEFGGQGRFKDEIRDAMGGGLLESLAQDVHFSLRVLRRSPGFTAVAVLTLALAIGANAVVFAVLDGIVLRPLNVPHPQDLFNIESRKGLVYMSYPDYADLRDRNRSFDGLAAFTLDQVTLDTGSGDPATVWAVDTSGNYFDVLRVQPYLGRFFHASDEHGINSAPYTVLSYTFWKNHFQADPNIAGRVIRLSRHPFTIIGVAPPDFYGAWSFFSPDLFLPFVNQEQLTGADMLHARATHSLMMTLGHLKAGVSTADAVADLDSIGAYLGRTYPRESTTTSFSLARPGLFGSFAGPAIRAFATGLMMLAGLILLAACANLGSLFAAHAADRARDIALRLSLGASPVRILRQLFTEAILISLAGGALGLWGSIQLLHILSVWKPVPRFPLVVPLGADERVYAAALVLAFLSGMLFAAIPARQAIRIDPYTVVKSGRAATGRQRWNAREVLVTAQIAICALLVTSSLVAVRGLAKSLRADFGFDPRNAMVMDTSFNQAGYRGRAVATMQDRMLKAVQAMPGVEAVGSIDVLPLYGGAPVSYVFPDETTELRASEATASAQTFKISPDYFHAAGTTLVGGRPFTSHDDQGSPGVAVINRNLAAKLFGSATRAGGRYFKLQDGTRLQVVGVVEDGKYVSLTESPAAALFLPVLQSPSMGTTLVIRSRSDPRQLAPALRSVMRNLDRALPVYIQTWEQAFDLVLFPSHVATYALGVLGALGAMLSVTGIFGVAAYSVSRRRKELGIRVALGAQRKEILNAALGRAFRLLATGSVAGLLFGILASRVLSNIVYQATPRDPLVLGSVAFTMLFLGLAAAWIPARRALSIDPLTLLRED
ncbi:MAG: ABC transporter permease [Bryobacterales bacterium]|nr:ABC transporter permease [Bryobacterales bacterium]MBV9398489.1 ABC transporter permease [Bryobacterales bacterium]